MTYTLDAKYLRAAPRPPATTTTQSIAYLYIPGPPTPAPTATSQCDPGFIPAFAEWSSSYWATQTEYPLQTIAAAKLHHDMSWDVDPELKNVCDHMAKVELEALGKGVYVLQETETSTVESKAWGRWGVRRGVVVGMALVTVGMGMGLM